MAERTISSGAGKCSIDFLRHDLTEIRLFATCSQEADAPTPIGKPSSEVIVLIDGKTVFMQRSKNGNFVDPGGELSYCGPDIQKKYVQDKTRK